MPLEPLCQGIPPFLHPDQPVPRKDSSSAIQGCAQADGEYSFFLYSLLYFLWYSVLLAYSVIYYAFVTCKNLPSKLISWVLRAGDKNTILNPRTTTKWYGHRLTLIRNANLLPQLGVAKDATPTEIKKAFHEMSFKYHPDKHTGLTKEEREYRAAMYTRITTGMCTCIQYSDMCVNILINTQRLRR